MGLRKASAYSRKIVRANTRKSKSKQKAYVKVVPPLKIVKFDAGNSKAYREGKHPFLIRLVALEKVQLRDNALESSRMFITKVMETNAPGQFYFGVRVFPHHILRENKTAAGAGADRISSGMSHCFGISIGRAAIVKAGKDIFIVSCENEKTARIARDALIAIKSKLPCTSRILFEKVAVKQ